MAPVGACSMNTTANPGSPRCDSLARVLVVLVETSHPGNIGAVARAMKTMGLSRLALVKPHQFPSAQATARAAGADDLLANARVCDSLAEAVADCAWVVGTSVRSRHIAWSSLGPEEVAAKAMAPGSGSLAIVFGRENSGLTNDELDHCNQLLTIPTDSGFRSLNIAAAVQIVAYELRRAVLSCGGQSQNAVTAVRAADIPNPRDDADSDRDPPSSSAELEGLFEHLERALIHAGYLDPNAPKLLMRRLRRLFGRSALLRSEVNILRGVLAAVESMDRITPRSSQGGSKSGCS